MTNKIIRRILGVAVFLSAGAGLAGASTISYYVDVFGLSSNASLCSGPCPNYTASTLGTGSGQTITFTIPQFNVLGNAAEGTPNAGYIFTLTNVALALSWQATGNVTIYNIGSSSNVSYNSATAQTVMTLQADGTQVTALGNATSGAGTVSYNNVASGPPLNIGDVLLSSLAGNGSNSQNSGNLGYFAGSNNSTYSAGVTINAPLVSGSSSDPNSSHLAFSGSGQIGAIATITYTYTQTLIPEPMTSAMVGGALLGLGALMRFRRARKVRFE
jgi:hypothetical protein